jgi:hypothetical protein
VLRLDGVARFELGQRAGGAGRHLSVTGFPPVDRGKGDAKLPRQLLLAQAKARAQPGQAGHGRFHGIPGECLAIHQLSVAFLPSKYPQTDGE